eukprot:11164634-Lingulodinium_polyedra.AAC.1
MQFPRDDRHLQELAGRLLLEHPPAHRPLPLRLYRLQERLVKLAAGTADIVEMLAGGRKTQVSAAGKQTK